MIGRDLMLDAIKLRARCEMLKDRACRSLSRSKFRTFPRSRQSENPEKRLILRAKVSFAMHVAQLLQHNRGVQRTRLPQASAAANDPKRHFEIAGYRIAKSSFRGTGRYGTSASLTPP